MPDPKKPFTVTIPEGPATAFGDHIERRGYLKWTAILGALRAYMALPPELQVWLNDPTATMTDPEVAEKMCDYFAARRREDLLARLPADQQQMLVELARETAERLEKKG